MPNFELAPAQWRSIHSFLKERSDLYIGDEAQCQRFIAAVLRMTRSGAPWRMLPAEYGRWNSVPKRYAAWCDRGIWAALHQHLAADPETEYIVLDSAIVRAHPDAAGAPQKGGQEAQGLGRSRGGFSSKVQITVDGLGNPLRFVLTGGQENDIKQAEALLQGYSGEYVTADKGYDAHRLREYIAKLGMTPVTPGRSGRRVSVVYDAHLYGERHLVECLINKVKHCRWVFTRYDKLCGRYLGFWHFAAALIWRH